MEKPLVEMALSKEQELFGYAKDTSLPGRCRQCRWLALCAGECPKNRFLVTHQGEPGLNYLCSGLQRYFEHIEPYVKAIAQKILRG
jgi:uncharacterized protein